MLISLQGLKASGETAGPAAASTDGRAMHPALTGWLKIPFFLGKKKEKSSGRLKQLQAQRGGSKAGVTMKAASQASAKQLQ